MSGDVAQRLQVGTLTDAALHRADFPTSGHWSTPRHHDWRARHARLAAAMRVSTPEESPAGSAHFIGEIDLT
jgi:hypothetical protein